MNTTRILLVAVLIVAAIPGCRDHAAEERRAREEAEAKAQAEARRREMDEASKVFKNRDPFKKNEPAPTSPAQDPKEPAR